MTCPIKPLTKPNSTAFGEPKPNEAATSTAGNEPGSNLLEIPWNAFVNSPTNILTPCININK